MDLGHTRQQDGIKREEIWLKLRIRNWDILGQWGGRITSPELKVLFLTGILVVLTGCSLTCNLLLLLLVLVEMTMSEAWLITISSTFASFLLTVPLLSENLWSPTGSV